MSNPVLSICIPTYKRAPFVDYLLTQAADWNFSFPYEIVISDNDSPDDTAKIVEKHMAAGRPIRYFKQRVNKGSLSNFLNGFHRAEGEYLIYLADDDLLIPEALDESVRLLLDHPRISALYAPWELYDDVSKRSDGNFYAIEEDVTFEPGQQIELLQLLLSRHIFPEIVIYRADAVRPIISDNKFCFWAFTYLAQVAARGTVLFSTKAFYRSVTATSVQDRSQAGIEQAMTDWDNYRGGLEYFVYSYLKTAQITLTDQTKLNIRNAIDGFIAQRMIVALRLWLGRKDYFRAYEIWCRLQHLEPHATTNLLDPALLQLHVFGQSLCYLVNSIADIDRLVLHGNRDAVQLQSFLKDHGLNQGIEITTQIGEPGASGNGRSFVLLSHEKDRQLFLDRGYGKGLILTEAEIQSSCV